MLQTLYAQYLFFNQDNIFCTGCTILYKKLLKQAKNEIKASSKFPIEKARLKACRSRSMLNQILNVFLPGFYLVNSSKTAQLEFDSLLILKLYFLIFKMHFTFFHRVLNCCLYRHNINTEQGFIIKQPLCRLIEVVTNRRKI